MYSSFKKKRNAVVAKSSFSEEESTVVQALKGAVAKPEYILGLVVGAV